MKLTFEQIREAAFGAATVTEQADGVHFCRFTPHQQEVYKGVSEDFFRKTFASAGIRLEFETDSRELRFCVRMEQASSRKFASTELFCDGQKLAVVGYFNRSRGDFEARADLGEGNHRVKIAFPWSASTVLQFAELTDGASFCAVRKTRKMLIFGDSITQGYDASLPSLSYASRLADGLDADARNKGIGGDVFFPALLDEAEDFAPDLITVAYGTNDWAKWSSEEEYVGKATDFYSRLSRLYPASRIFALTPIWRKDAATRETRTGSFADLENKISLAVQGLPNVRAVVCRDFVPADPSLFSPDGVHPNDRGFDDYCKALMRVLQEELSEQKKQ